MNRFAYFTLAVAACASAPPAGIVDARIEGFAVEPVREAARIVVVEVAHPQSVVRVTDDGSVLTEGWIGVCGEDVTCASSTHYPSRGATPWATIEVRFRDLGTDTDVEVEIVYEDCDPAVDCLPELLASTGALERKIVDRIRAHLEAGGRG